MTTRLLIPAAAAASLHAFVLFGLRWPHVEFPPPPKELPRQCIPIDTSEPPVVTTSDVDDTSKPLGQPDVVLRSEEPPPPADATGLTMPTPLKIPRVGPVSTTLIPAGPIGVPDGKPGIDGPGTITATHLDNAPRTRSQIEPVYPYQAKKDGLSGQVFVEFLVNEDGRVLNPRVLRSTNVVFESAALHAVEKWRFEPGRKNGRVVSFRMAVPMEFTIRE